MIKEVTKTLASLMSVEPAILQAVLDIESGGSGFRNGRLVVRFEPHIFWRVWGKSNPDEFYEHFRFLNNEVTWRGNFHQFKYGVTWHFVHQDQDSEHMALNTAMSLARESALKSTSMGAPQIMGFNHEMIGYKDADEMFRTFRQSETPQIIGLAFFLLKSGAMQKLREKDYTGFARIYNGSGQAEFYGNLIEHRIQLLGG